MLTMLGGKRIVCVVDIGAAGVFCSSAIQSQLYSEAAQFYKRAPPKTMRLNTAEGVTSGIFECFTIPVVIENSVNSLIETFTVLPKLADDICLLGMSFFDSAMGYIRSSTGQLTFEFFKSKTRQAYSSLWE